MSQEEDEEAKRAVLERLRRRHEAYVKLFGPLGDPTPYGAEVLADLDVFCKTHDESIHMDSTGRMDPYTTIYRDGKKAVALRIRKMLEWNDVNSD